MDKKMQTALEITFITMFMTGVILAIIGAVKSNLPLLICGCFATVTAGTLLAITGRPKKKRDK